MSQSHTFFRMVLQSVVPLSQYFTFEINLQQRTSSHSPQIPGDTIINKQEEYEFWNQAV